MSNDHQQRFILAEDFLNGSLTPVDAESLCKLLESDPAFLEEFRNLTESDFLLIEQIRQIRGTTGLSPRGRTRIPIRLNEEELNELARIPLPRWKNVPFESDPDLFDIEPLFRDQDPEVNTTMISTDPIPMLSAGGILYRVNLPTGKKTNGKNLLFGRTGLFLSALIFVFAVFGIWALIRSAFTPSNPIPDENFQPIAHLAEMIDAVWSSEGPNYKRGQGIGPNKLFLKSGLARIQFENGADLVLEGPAEFVVNGPMNSFCGKGKISARIPKEAIGFEIATPFATVIDRGTEFYLDVNEKKAEVSVIKGLVDFVPPNQTVQALTEKMASSIDLSMRRRSIPFDSRNYYTSKKFESVCQNYSNKIAGEEEVINTALNGRSDLLVRYDFNRKDLNSIPNAAAGSKSIEGSASIFRSISCEGTRYGTFAALLNREKSRIDLPMSGTFRDLTLFLTVRPDKLDRTGSILLSTEEDENATSFVLQIFYNGALKFRINQPGGLDYQEIVSDPFFFKTNYGTWYDLAVVIDSQSQKISLYADGEKLAENSCPDLKPMDLRPITIGNNPHKTTKGETRFFGAVGDFMIFNRSLSQKDLQQIRKNKGDGK